MRNRLMAMDFPKSPRPAAPPVETFARKGPVRPRGAARPKVSSIRGVMEIVSETLCIALLLMVIGFLAWKFPQISSAVDEISGSNSHSPAPAGAAAESRVRELETRMAGYENKLAPIEKNYAQLKQRHADLQKAYDSLRSASVREAYSPRTDNPRVTAAP